MNVTSSMPPATSGFGPWTLRHWISDRKIDVVKYGNGIVRIRRSVLDRYVASCTIKARAQSWTKHEGIATSRRGQCGIRSGIAGSLRFGIQTVQGCESGFAASAKPCASGPPSKRRSRTAPGTSRRPRTVTFATALKQYREYSTVQNRSHRSYVEPALSMWEAQMKTNALLGEDHARA